MSDNTNPKGGAGDSPDTLSSLLDNTVTNKELFDSTTTRFKVVTSGRIVEIYEFEDPVRFGPKSVFEKKYIDDEDDIRLEQDPDRAYLPPRPERSEEYKKRNANRAKNKVRRLVQSNFAKQAKFVTLTFRNTKRFDITSLKACLGRFQHFTKKLRAFSPFVRYIAVPEFQDANDRGAVHYHLITDLDFIKIEDLRKLWRYGFVKINKIHNPTAAAFYLAKYFTKSALDERFEGRRTFYASRNLKQPKTNYGDKYAILSQKLEEQGFKPSYQSEYFSEWNGNVKYSSYNLYEEPVQKDTNDQ